MANQKIIEGKQQTVNEIVEKMNNSKTYVLFEYHGLTVEETNELRRTLKENDAEFKIYKNTLTKRALDQIKINLDEHLNGPKAIAFGNDEIAPIKVLADFANKHKALEIKVGVVNGEITDKAKLDELSKVPSREGLLTMLASGLMGTIRDLSIGLDLYSKQKEEN